MSNQIVIDTHSKDARYNLSKKIALLSTVLLLTISVIYFIEGDFSAYVMLVGGVISLISYTCIIRAKKYYYPVILCLISLSILNMFNLGIASNFHHIGDFFWVISIVLAGFFMLGKKWGIGLITLNLLAIFVIFYLIRTGAIVQIKKPFTTYSQLNFFINLCIGGTLFSFLVLEFLKENNKAVSRYIKSNEELEILNKEKTIMLTEIHHRVKNNLQIVTSLLRLQSNDIDNQKITDEFSLAINRISAIAKIHEKMYNNEALNQIDLSEYLNNLVQDLLDSYTNEKKISTKINSNINSIPPKDLVPIALIFNELVTNSVKHAFTNQKECSITIDANISDLNNVKLVYHDNGTWKEPTTNTVGGMGLELIDSFVNQLDGAYVVEKVNGTTYIILFQLKTDT